MLEIIKRIIVNVLITIYRSLGFSVVLAILFMFLYLFAKEQGWRKVIKQWKDSFRDSSNFRRLFFLSIYIAMILFRTLLNRSMSENPISDVIGVWGLYNQNGELTTEVIENLALFIPFAVLLLCSFKEKLVGETVKLFMTVWQSVKIVFLFSFAIELTQLFLRVGTFQLSDLFYNTLGGFIGGLIYWCGYKITHRKQD